MRYCSTHKRTNVNINSRRDFDRLRGSSCKRGYGRRWEKLRKRILARDPLCCARANLIEMIAIARRRGELEIAAQLEPHIVHFCDGTRPSTDVDHIIPKPVGDDNEDNLQGTDHECHSYKTAVFDSNFIARGRGVKIPETLALADRQRKRDTRPRNKNSRVGRVEIVDMQFHAAMQRKN
jgi:5-methylcytosine-specific restriction endonuclease McrA